MCWRTRFRQRYDELKATEGLTQEKLAEQLDVTQGTIAHWMRGRRSPEDLAAFERLAQALKVHPAWLLYGVNKEGSGDGISREAMDFGRAWERLPARERAAIRAAIEVLVGDGKNGSK